MPAENTTTITIGPAEAGQSLSAIALRLGGPDPATVLARGGLWYNRQRARDLAEPAELGGFLELRRPPGGIYAECELPASAIAYEDAALLVINKASGWYSGATPWDTQGNLLAATARFLAERDGSAPTLHLAQQLDRETSGLLIIGKDPAINPALRQIFLERQIEKRYLALCAGQLPQEGLIRSGHGRAAAGRWRTYPLESIGEQLPNNGGSIKYAETAFQRREQFSQAALIELDLRTGRTHQIRLHMADLGHPLLGDSRYGGPSEPDGFYLHAALLSLHHPLTGELLRLEAPLPPRFVARCAEFRLEV